MRLREVVAPNRNQIIAITVLGILTLMLGCKPNATEIGEIAGDPVKPNPVKELTPEEMQKSLRDSVVGEYDYKEGSPAYRILFLENGIRESYRNGEKRNDAKWSISKGELHVVHDFGEIHIFRINKDKSITEISLIKDKKRSDWPYEVNTLKKIK